MHIEDYVSQRIEELLVKNDFSIYRLSQLTGITQSALGDIVKQKTLPTLVTLERICAAFNVSVADFFTTDEMKRNELSAETLEFVKMFEELSAEDRRYIKISMQSLKEKE